MTDEDKKNRRDRIARTSAARSRRTYTFWVTRDRFPGSPGAPLAQYVRVWYRRPWREVHTDGRMYWVSRYADGSSALHEDWALSYCARQLRTTPDDERQVLVYDGGMLAPDGYVAPQAAA